MQGSSRDGVDHKGFTANRGHPDPPGEYEDRYADWSPKDTAALLHPLGVAAGSPDHAVGALVATQCFDSVRVKPSALGNHVSQLYNRGFWVRVPGCP